MIVELLLGDFRVGVGRLLECRFGGGGTPAQQVNVIIGSIFHHGLGKMTSHDVVLMLAE